MTQNKLGHAVHARACIESLQTIRLMFTLDTSMSLWIFIHPYSTQRPTLIVYIKKPFHQLTPVHALTSPSSSLADAHGVSRCVRQ
jgi:hypothetical protein